MQTWRLHYSKTHKLRDLEAEMLKMVCNDVQIEPVLQEINGEVLTPGMNRAADAQLDIHARGFWEQQGSIFFDVSVCYQMQSLIEA